MKAYFARRKADGKFLGKGRGSYHTNINETWSNGQSRFPDFWTKMGILRRCASVKNTYGKRYNNSTYVPIDLANDYDIIEVDLGRILREEVSKLEAIEKALLFGSSS